jgi:hypothetical protein
VVGRAKRLALEFAAKDHVVTQGNPHAPPICQKQIAKRTVFGRGHHADRGARTEILNEDGQGLSAQRAQGRK